MTRTAMASTADIVPRGMVIIPAGFFIQGSPPGDGHADERPQRRVWVDAFAIDRLPVTNRDFGAFIDAGGYERPELWDPEGWLWAHWGGHRAPFWWHGDPEDSGPAPVPAGPAFPDHPVIGVTWYEANAYARWAGKRLPTEAEWEKAARGTDGRRFPWGDQWEPSRANTRDGGSGTLEPVGARPGGASPFGVLDLVGNCFEWCADWYDPAAYRTLPERNPWLREASGRTRKVCRGGAFDYRADGARCAHRAYYLAKLSSVIGFRCALPLAP